MLRPLLLLAALLSLASCAAPTPFRCDREGASCDAPGVCANGYCAVAGPECVSGLRYSSTALNPGACAVVGSTDAAIDVVTQTDAPDAVVVPDADVVTEADVAVVDASVVDVTDASDVPVDAGTDVPALDAADVPRPLDVPAPIDVPPDVRADAAVDVRVDAPVDVPVDVPSVTSTAVAFRRPLSSPGSSRAVLAMATGDVDADGSLDVALALVGGQVDVYRNAGDGTFTRGALIVSTAVRALALADINGDGRADLVTLGSSVSFHTSLAGTFGFGTANFLGASTGATSLRVAQVYGSAALDVVFGTPASNGITVIPGPLGSPGSAVFTVTAPVRPDVLETVDLDRDGFAEIVVLNTSGTGNWVGVMQGSALGPLAAGQYSFTPSAATVDGVVPRSLVVGNIDLDLDLDLVIVDDGGITLAQNPGVRAPLTTSERVTLGVPVRGGAAGNFTSDGIADIAIDGDGDGLVHLFRSPYTATPSPVSFAVPGDVVASAAGDFNRDNLDDLLVYADGLHLLAGGRNGSLSAPRAILTCTSPGDVALTHLAGAMLNNVIVACGSTLNVHGLDRSLDVAIATAQVPVSLTADAIVLADFADDDYDDLLVTSRGTRRSQLFTVIDGTLSTIGVFPSGAALAAGNLDTRPGVDLVTATDATLTTLVVQAREFVVAQSLPLTVRSFADVQIAQFDGDARPEVLALDVLRNEVFAMSASTTGTLTPTARTYPILPGAQRLLALPVTPAADTSLAVTFRTGNDAVVYRRDGASLTVTGSTDTMNSTLAGILGGPVTTDRCHDLVTWHTSGARIDVHPSNCTGALAPHVALATYAAASVALGDVDGDRDLDLLVTHRPVGPRAGYFSVWINVAR